MTTLELVRGHGCTEQGPRLGLRVGMVAQNKDRARAWASCVPMSSP